MFIYYNNIFTIQEQRVWWITNFL